MIKLPIDRYIKDTIVKHTKEVQDELYLNGIMMFTHNSSYRRSIEKIKIVFSM